MIELALYGFIGDRYDRCDSNSVRQFLADNPGDESILVRIASPGGIIFDGLATYELLAEAQMGVSIPHMDPKPPREVHVMIDGMAASMATVIAMVGKTISIADNSLFMIHNPSGGVFFGDSKDLRDEANRLDLMRDQALSIYAGRTGGDRDSIKEMMDKETWMTAQEAVENGFCTDIVELTVTKDDAEETMAANIKPSLFSRLCALKDKAFNIAQSAAKLSFEVPKNFAGITIGATMVVAVPVAAQTTPEPAPVDNPAPSPALTTPTPPASAQETTDMNPLNLDGTPATTPEQIAAWEAMTEAQKATARAAATALERTARGRTNASIRTLGARLNVSQEQINEAIDQQMNELEAARMFANIEADSEVLNESNNGPRIQVMTDRTMQAHERAAEDFYVGLSLMAHNENCRHDQRREISPSQRAAASRTLSQIARDCLAAGGHTTRGISDAEVMQRAARMNGVHTTADFGLHLATSFQRVAGAGYDLSESINFDQWTDTIYVPDFRTVNIVSAGAFSGLREIPEGGSFEQMTTTEYGTSVEIKKRGGDFSLSLEAGENANADPTFLGDKAFRMGQRARADEQKVAELALIRGTYRDSITGQRRVIYNIDAGTQLSAEMDFGVAAFNEATVKLRMQQEPNHAKLFEDAEDGISEIDRIADKDYLGLRLRLALVGAEAEPLANVMQKAFKYKDADGNEYDNPYVGTFNIVPLLYTDPRDYYLMDRPGAHPVVSMIRQRGNVGPKVFPIMVNDGLSMRWGVLNRIAAAVTSERGVVRGRRPA